jgi:HK97 gp10 family phage protein
MTALSVQLKGFEELDRRLAGMSARIQNRVLRRALRVTANRFRDRLRGGTPVDQGKARRAVNVKVKVSGKAAYAAVRYKGRPQMYMRIRDRGSRRQPARPFFEQTMGNWRAEAVHDFSVAVREAVETHGGID